MQVEIQNIAGKPVAVFDHHHHALIPWAESAKAHSIVRLFTIDWHCDTHEAFLRAAFDGKAIDRTKQAGLIARIDSFDPDTVKAAVKLLRHDEHIDAAARAGIIDAALIVAKQNERTVRSLEEQTYEAQASELDPSERLFFYRDVPRPTPPMTYRMPSNRLVAINPPEYSSRGSLVSAWPDRVLESDFLEDRLAIFEDIVVAEGGAALLEAPYILDLDLDAFNSAKAMNPDDPSTFYRLIRGAIGITVAREPDCFATCWETGAAPPVEEAERLILAHIERALEGN